MSEISRQSLFGKLNPNLFRAIEGATVFAKLRGNPYVEFVHWLHQLMQASDSDLHRILKRFEVNEGLLAGDIVAAMDRLPRGATSISDLSAHLEDVTERAWVYGTLMFGEQQVRSGHLVVGMLKTNSLRNLLHGISRELQRINVDTLTEEFQSLLAGSPEAQQLASDGFGEGEPGSASQAMGAQGMSDAALGKQEALKKFTVDLTQRARDGKLDPVSGRDDEVRQIIDILMRRRQNNPILTGEAGVGKTAVVEGFALRIVKGDVPPQLREVRLLTLDIGLLQAGASMKGEFENRLRQVIDEVQASPKPIVLFIDEAHTLVGAGGAAGTGDAANLLKPALARGTLRTIGATTWAEYKKYFEKDPALTRRFQVVQVLEPDEAKAIVMMRGVASALEKHHKVLLLDAAIEASVRLSHRYIPARQLPDKSVSLLDTACARVAVSQHATPARVEDCIRRIEALQVEKEIIEREQAVGQAIGDRLTEVQSRIVIEEQALATLNQSWGQEKILVDQVLDLRSQLRAEPAPAQVERDALLEKLQKVQQDLAVLQGDDPLMLPSVDEQAVAAVVADWTGIPVGRMVKNEIASVLKLADTLDERVIGQKHALDMIAKRVQTSRAKLDNPNKPIGVFMLVGPSGVGKTETAMALAETLYGGEQNAIVINMSEFQEAHTVSTLKGAPPGYVGYGEGGVLTEAVRRRPYSVVLLDEVEKAHPDVHEIFFQVFDKGWMEDGEGRLIDFRNTIILLTSNVGSDLIMNLCKEPDLMPEPDAIAKSLREPLLKVFPAALLGRIVTIPYYPLSDVMLASIIKLQLNRIVKRVRENHKTTLSYDDALVQLIISRCAEVESGGRMIDAILTNTVLPRISQEYLNAMANGQELPAVLLSATGGDITYTFAPVATQVR